jgi:cytochrome c oxidase assembly protein subunit 15
LIIFLQICIGAFVSGMDAGKIYNSWPLMGSGFFPDDNSIQNLFYLSAFNDPSLVQFMHRNLAYLIFLFYIFIFIKVYQNRLSGLFTAINVAGFLLILQIILGILTLLFDAHIVISSMHQISSILLVSSSIYFLYLNNKSN